MSRVTILGAGMMGSALSVPLSDAGHDVRLVGTHLDEAIIAQLAADHYHLTLRQKLPPAVAVYPLSQWQAAVDGADVIALGVSSAGIPWASQKLRELPRPLPPILMITKGLALAADASALARGSAADVLSPLPDVVAAQGATGSAPVAVAGPCIAGELARRVSTAVVFSSRDAALARRLAQSLSTPYYRALPSDDLVGVEICAALKNAYAMGMAFPQGMHERAGGTPGSVALHNMEATLFAQSVSEMGKLVELLGGSAQTASGLAGVGDLHVTCNGGRTGRFGRLLGQGLSSAAAVERMQGATLECLEVLAVMREVLERLAQAGHSPAPDLPLLTHLIDVALGGAAVDIPFDKFRV